MAKKSTIEDSNEQPGAGARLYQYQVGQKPQLSPERELQLALQIQQGNFTLNQLHQWFTNSVISSFQEADFSPLAKNSVLEAVKVALRNHLITCAGANCPPQDFIAKVLGMVRNVIGEMLDDADPHNELDIEVWLDTYLSSRNIEADLLAEMPEVFNSWSELVARETAINEMAEAHMGLAKPFAMKAMKQAFELDDLLNEAFLILRCAAETFDPHSENRFSSYAMTALKRGLKRTSPSLIGLKRQTATQLRAFDNAEEDLAKQSGSQISANSVYEFLGCDPRTRIQIENVRRILGSSRQSHHDAESYQDAALHELDSQAANPVDIAIDREEEARLAAAFERLAPLEQTVIIGRTKLGKSFRSLGKELHKSPNTLRGVFTEALKKLAQRVDPKRSNFKPR